MCMIQHDMNAEEKIFEAAQDVFIQKGFDGARMQDIAEKAGLNKALLHYYYRTKERLFNAIFAKVFSHFIPKVVVFIESDATLFEKIEFFVHNYIDVIIKNPYIPNFILNELNRNPDNIAKLLGEVTSDVRSNAFLKFKELIKSEIVKGNIKPIEPEQLIVNMLALCIFPFVAKPILQVVLFNGDKKDYQEFLIRRKKEVTEFIINSLKNS